MSRTTEIDHGPPGADAIAPHQQIPVSTVRARFLALLALLPILAGCTGGNSPGEDVIPTPGTRAVEVCDLQPAIVPTPPVEVPGYAELDPTTGLHITGTAPELDVDDYRLEVTGQVGNPLSLTYDDLRCMQKVERHTILVCPGLFQDEATWAGVPLADILALAGAEESAQMLRLVGADGYRKNITLNMATSDQGFLAYEWEGEPLPILHGFPVRAVFPDQNGSFWVKWLIQIDVIASLPRNAPGYLDEFEGR
jgi:DMSO/TMAO reductase YedYZ molybdopterin-dependent catalytic subunit